MMAHFLFLQILQSIAYTIINNVESYEIKNKSDCFISTYESKVRQQFAKPSLENILLNLDVYRKIDFRFLSLSKVHRVKQALPNQTR